MAQGTPDAKCLKIATRWGPIAWEAINRYAMQHNLSVSAAIVRLTTLKLKEEKYL